MDIVKWTAIEPQRSSKSRHRFLREDGLLDPRILRVLLIVCMTLCVNTEHALINYMSCIP